MFVVNGIGCLFNISLCFVFHTLALREELTQKTIAVLIGAPFPWRIWVGEVDLAAFDLGHIRKLRAIVKRDRLDVCQSHFEAAFGMCLPDSQES